MIRLTEAEIDTLDAEYSRIYPLYNVISTVVEDYEGSKGGLRAVEVWREVLDLETRLPTAPRPDRFIASERTRLMKKFRRFMVYYKGELCRESAEDRSDEDVERSLICVLLAFGMRLASYPEGMDNPYEPIMRRIRKMALQCKDLEMVAAITNEYYDAEDEEEELGNFVPEEDVLRPHVRPRLTSEMQAIHDRLKPVFTYFADVLVYEKTVSANVAEEVFYGIWDNLLMNESILKELDKPNQNIRNTLTDEDIKEGDHEYIVKDNSYNLKLVLNIIGVMIEQKVVTSNISTTRKMFFDDMKDKYFNPRFYKMFGTADSAFPTDGMYSLIVKIINEHVGNK